MNAQSGVCTPAGGLVTGRAPTPLCRLQHPLPGLPGRGGRGSGTPVSAGALVLLSLAYLTSLFYYIPKAALAAVIISAVVPMFDAGIFRTLWRVKSEGTSWERPIPRRSAALPAEHIVLGALWDEDKVQPSLSRLSCRAGPCAPLCDVPALLLGGPVRHHGRGAGLGGSPALLHGQAPSTGGLHTSPAMHGPAGVTRELGEAPEDCRALGSMMLLTCSHPTLCPQPARRAGSIPGAESIAVPAPADPWGVRRTGPSPRDGRSRVSPTSRTVLCFVPSSARLQPQAPRDSFSSSGVLRRCWRGTCSWCSRGAACTSQPSSTSGTSSAAVPWQVLLQKCS